MGHLPVEQRRDPLAFIEEIAEPEIAMHQRDAARDRGVVLQPTERADKNRVRLHPMLEELRLPRQHLLERHRFRFGRAQRRGVRDVDRVQLCGRAGEIEHDRAVARRGLGRSQPQDVGRARDPFQDDRRCAEPAAVGVQPERPRRTSATLARDLQHRELPRRIALQLPGLGLHQHDAGDIEMSLAIAMGQVEPPRGPGVAARHRRQLADIDIRLPGKLALEEGLEPMRELSQGSASLSVPAHRPRRRRARPAGGCRWSSRRRR